MDQFKNLVIIICSFFVSYLLALKNIFWILYDFLFPSLSGGFFGGEILGEFIVSILLAFIFLTPLFLKVFGFTKVKGVWTALFVLPPIVFLSYLDLYHSWFFILLAVLGWLLGWGISHLRRKDA